MTTFDKRDKGFENKFARDEELSFKINARRNKLLGLWAAEKLGQHGSDAEQYAQDLVLAEFETSHDVTEHLLKDFKQAGVAVTARDIQAEMDRLAVVARKQILGDAF